MLQSLGALLQVTPAPAESDEWYRVAVQCDKDSRHSISVSALEGPFDYCTFLLKFSSQLSSRMPY